MDVPPPFNKELVIGVVLVGIFFNTYLYGLVTSQFLTYWRRDFKDDRWIKAIVAILFIVDTLHSGVAVYAAWEMCVTNFGNFASFARVGWTIPFTATATAVAAIFTQFFLGHRVFMLTQSKLLVAIIGLLSATGFIFGCIAGVKSGILAEIARFKEIENYVIVWLSAQTAADLSITAALIYGLSRSRTGFRKTDTMINRLIRGAIQTGLFASIFAMGDLVSFVHLRTTNLYAMFAYPIGRIYTNTLLDTLNSRADMKRYNHGTDIINTDHVFHIPGDVDGDAHSLRTYPTNTGDVEAGHQLTDSKHR